VIDWRKTQANIGAGVDGDPGRETWGRLMGKAVGHPYDETMRRLGESAAKHFPLYAVSTSIDRISGVTAEMGHESGGFRKWEENLSYSAQRLAEVWPGRFARVPTAKVKKPNDLALRIAGKPAEIARETYGLRMGNKSGANDNDRNEDGWQYRGRGGLMLTGKDNYIAMGEKIGVDLLRFPELAADPFTSLLIALQFMQDKGTLRLMDKKDDKGERKSVNGGLIGFDHVQLIRKETRKLLVAA
jgi:putative chitinase